MRIQFPLTALALACAPVALAQPETESGNKLEQIVVTSSRIEMPLRYVATSVSVITAEEIEARGFTTIQEVLRSQPGVAISSNGGLGATSALRIRGEDGFRTRAYLDGISLDDTSGPQAAPRFEHLLSSGIARAEILRGPQGLMYGADAGGVVSLTTASAAERFAGQLHAEGGQFGTRQLGSNLSGTSGPVDWVVLASDVETDGYNARSTDSVAADDDGYRNTSLHTKLGWQAGDKLRFEWVGRDVQSSSDYDGCYTAAFSPSNECRSDFDQRIWRLSAEYGSGAWQHRLSVADNQTDRQAYTESSPTFGSEGEQTRWTYVGDFNALESATNTLRFVYGAESLTESFDDGSGGRERDQLAGFAEVQAGTGNLFVTLGARQDDNDDFGQYSTFRVSAAYRIPVAGGEWKLKSSYGTGFRAPSLYEEAYNAGPYAWGEALTTDLKEEQSKGYDLGAALALDSGLYLEATYFDQVIDNEIFYDLVAYTGYLQSSGRSESTGVELTAELPVSDSLSLTANYTYNDAKTREDGPRARRPEHLANIGVVWMQAQWRVGAHLRGSFDAVDTDGTALDDYQVLDINGSYDLRDNLQLFARVENLLGEAFEEVPTYYAPDTAAYAGVRYQF